MTLQQIDAKLPRVATWPPNLYDLTDHKERIAAIIWIQSLLDDLGATIPQPTPTPDPAAQADALEWIKALIPTELPTHTVRTPNPTDKDAQ